MGNDGLLSGQAGNLVFFLIAGGIGYCRYNLIRVPVLDDLLQKFWGQMRGPGGGYSAPVHDASSTLTDALAGKPMAVEDLLMQVNRFCGKKGACTKEYWDKMPDVAAAVKRGPGTWDRKKLKKTSAQELDEILGNMARRPQARKRVVWNALRSLAKELFDVTPKSMKESMASKVAIMDSTSPPEGFSEGQAEVEVEDDPNDIVVDNLP